MTNKKIDWAHLATAEQWSGKEIELLLFSNYHLEEKFVSKLQREKKAFKKLIKASNFKIKNALFHTEEKMDGSINKMRFLKWYKKNGYPVRPELEEIFNSNNHAKAEPWIRQLQNDFFYYVQSKD